MQPSHPDERIAETDQGIHLLGVGRENRLVDRHGPLVISHPRVQPRNPDSRLDVVGVCRRERLKALERRPVRPAASELFRLRPRIGGGLRGGRLRS